MWLARIVPCGILLIVSTLAFVFDLTEGAAQSGKAGSPPMVELKVLKYNELGDAVRAQRGKVVLVEVWADW
jgi:hypothetical protein